MAEPLAQYTQSLGQGRMGDQAGLLFILGSLVTAMGLCFIALELYAAPQNSLMFATIPITVVGIVFLSMTFFLNRSPSHFEEVELYTHPVRLKLRRCSLCFDGPNKKRPARTLFTREFTRDEIYSAGYDLLSIGGDGGNTYYYLVVLYLSGAGKKTIGEFRSKAEAERLLKKISERTELPILQSTVDTFSNQKTHHSSKAYETAWQQKQPEEFEAFAQGKNPLGRAYMIAGVFCFTLFIIVLWAIIVYLY